MLRQERPTGSPDTVHEGAISMNGDVKILLDIDNVLSAERIGVLEEAA